MYLESRTDVISTGSAEFAWADVGFLVAAVFVTPCG